MTDDGPPFRARSEMTIDVSKEVIDAAEADGINLDDQDRLEIWITNHTQYDVNHTVDGEPLDEYLERRDGEDE
jgi:hypothetical protein